MALKFLKRRNGKQAELNHKLSTTAHSARCDESTDSGRSNTSKASLAEQDARNGKWESVLKIVQQSSLDDWNASTSNDTHSFHQTTTPLHLVLANRAPLKVVESMIDIMKTKFEVPSPEESQDEFGRTPLHVAVTVGCDEETVMRLLTGEALVMPAVLKDENQQTPLHAACVAPIGKQKKKNAFAANPTAMLKWNKRRVIAVLMEQYPEAAAITDKFGKTPVEYAREQGMKDSSVSQLEFLANEYSSQELISSESDFEVSADLKSSDVPFIVPSLTGSCRNFNTCSMLDLAEVEHHANDDASDVSTIGDNEAVMSLDDF